MSEKKHFENTKLDNTPRCWMKCTHYDTFVKGDRVDFSELCDFCPLRDFQEAFSCVVPEMGKRFYLNDIESNLCMEGYPPCRFCNFKKLSRKLEPCNSCNSEMRRNMLSRGQIRIDIRGGESDVTPYESKEDAEKELLNRYRQVRRGVAIDYPEQIGLTDEDLFPDPPAFEDAFVTPSREEELERVFEESNPEEKID